MILNVLKKLKVLKVSKAIEVLKKWKLIEGTGSTSEDPERY